jgi:membrane associated rhomboid family serine protease
MIAVKLRIAVLPLLAASVGFVLLYSAFNWYLVTGTGILPLDREIAEYWLPAVLPLIVAALFVRPGIRRLRLSEARNVPFFYFAVAVAAIAIPAIAAQLYVSVAAGGIGHVAAMAGIASAPRTRFYAVDKVCLDRAGLGTQLAIRPPVMGNTADVDLYVAVPSCDGGGVIGLKYHTQVETRLSDAEQDAQIHAFLQRAQAKFDAEDPSRYKFLARQGTGYDLRNFASAVAKAKIRGAAPTVFVPHEEDYDGRTGNRLFWVLIAFAAPNLLWLAMVLFAPLKAAGEEDEAAETAGVARALFIPSRANYGLPLLLDVNILVFLAMVLRGLGVASFQSEDLMAWGANYSSALHGWGAARLITSQFVHAGLAHIAANMYALVFMSLFIAPVVRNAGLIASYLICGLGGAVASAVLHPDTVSVGASGAIMGLCGMLLALALWRDARVAVSSRVILANVGLSVVLTLGLGFAMPNIDNAAHIGGLATGFVLGTLLYLAGGRKDAAAGG